MIHDRHDNKAQTDTMEEASFLGLDKGAHQCQLGSAIFQDNSSSKSAPLLGHSV
ncbi:hypothetical protein SODALDRAFT_359021 [Sodiomyces alkalinus F11]|uniref:Uncharacterized protein n=1 Tax=Sodiomyces alkalinus (strain CBS 110278 / VKM F-3762 / F11) TaxID=1314773 RepID=A0A3N2PXF9_SODAK|nr:hypothetical protein SODALDRAFT_359021 [Sodiomyces alkalinus F11]ROT39154.1 hypothetical protein SODALDRAFT_359021 [Sodiomyces alkalinus F11]